MTRVDSVRGRLFTSTLTAGEGLVARAAGIVSLAQVMGSSFFHVGWRFTNQSGEVDSIARALVDARRAALGRMLEEAKQAGADAVLGVRLAHQGYHWSGETVEYTAVGTAVKIDGMPAEIPRPALSILDADGFVKARRLGLWPIGIAIGSATWYERHCDCASEGSWWNQPLLGHLRVAETVETLARRRFKDSAAELRASGVVGVHVHRHGHDIHYENNDTGHTAFRLELTLLGTAVLAGPRVAAPTEKRLVVIDLKDGLKEKKDGR